MATKKRRKSKKISEPQLIPVTPAEPAIVGLGFVSSEDVQNIAQRPPTLTPEQQELSKAVDLELARQSEEILFQAPKEGMELMLTLLQEAKIDSMDDIAVNSFKQRLKAIPVGAYMTVGRLAVVHTVEGNIEEVGSYLTKMERSLIAMHRRMTEAKT